MIVPAKVMVTSPVPLRIASPPTPVIRPALRTVTMPPFSSHTRPAAPSTVTVLAARRTVPLTVPPSSTVTVWSPEPRPRMSPVTAPEIVAIRSPAKLRSASRAPSISTPVSVPPAATVTAPPLL